jgi:hypothetical protein
MKIILALLCALTFQHSFDVVTSQEEPTDEITEEDAILAAQDSPCEQFWIDFCVSEAHRFCYIDEEAQTEKCGACLPGSFEWRSRCLSAQAFQFVTFLEEFDPQYLTSLSNEERYALLKAAIAFIVKHNAKNPPPPYELSLTPFSADTAEDTSQRQGFIPDREFNDRQQDFRTEAPMVQNSGASPAAVNWKDQGAVTSVKDQGRW